jgi:alpha-glucosidase
VGSFSPFFRSHVATGTPDQEPWSFGPEVEDVARRMLAVRYALLPYWYEAFVAANATGAPIVRPLWLEAPGDDEAFKHEDEYFVGPSLLAAPVTAANVTSRAVYLPAGVFYDFYTGAAYTGPTTVTLPAPLGRVPLLVRGGSVLHEQDVPNYVGETPGGPEYLDVYPGGASTQTSTTLVADDGETFGPRATTSVALAVTASAITLTLGGRTGSYTPPAHATTLRVHGVGQAPTATIDGAAASVTYDPNTRVATLPLADVAATHTIVLTGPTTLVAPRQVNVAFTVTLPSNTPANDSIYVASSAGGWQPNGLLLTRNGTTATGTLSVLEGTLLKYKVTRSAWANVEVDGSCATIPNRIATAEQGAPAVGVTVAHWTDVCP